MNIAGYHIKIGNATDVGKVREQNEDYMAHFVTPIGYCIVVCDGMGGHAAGQVASQNSIVSIQRFLQDSKHDNTVVPIVLKNAIEFANYQLREMVNKNPDLKGMGTTCVLALIKGGQVYTAHAGDSRIYLIRGKSITQITKDHSAVQKLIDIGALTEEEAELSDKRNEIIKAIGIFEKVDPTITQTALALHKNDKLLLCSDGLTGHVNKEKINEAVQSINDIQNAALKLIALANDDGGSDNITVQLVHYTGKTVGAKRRFAVRKMVALFILLVAAGYLSFWLYKKNYGAHKITNARAKDSARKSANPSQNIKAIKSIPNNSTAPKK